MPVVFTVNTTWPNFDKWLIAHIGYTLEHSENFPRIFQAVEVRVRLSSESSMV